MCPRLRSHPWAPLHTAGEGERHEPAGAETCPCRESDGKVGRVVLAWTPLGTGWSLDVSLEEHWVTGWESGCARGSRAAGADVEHVHA